MKYLPKFRKLNTPLLFIIPLLLTSLLCSCEQGLKLSNENAMQVLNQEYREFCSSYPKYAIFSHIDHDFSKIEAVYDNLKSLGLVTVRKKTFPKGESMVEISPTQKAIEEYDYKTLHPSVAVTKLVAVEILGISINEETKSAEVLFIGEYERTPFTELAHKKDLCKPGQRFEKKATFIHYDSGWRLKESGE